MINVTHGSCIDFDVDFKEADGAPEDISRDMFAIIEARPAALAQAELTKTEPGRLHFHLAAEHSAKLMQGTTNRFRISRVFDDGCIENTLPIMVATR